MKHMIYGVRADIGTRNTPTECYGKPDVLVIFVEDLPSGPLDAPITMPAGSVIGACTDAYSAEHGRNHCSPSLCYRPWAFR